MIVGHINPEPILLLVNYWEIPASEMGSRLDQLLKRGVHQIATFVPWQVAESDISHSLTRFLQCVADRHLSAFLIVSPEVGVHFHNSGLPKDVVLKKENRAKHSQQGNVTAILPPNCFQIPSLFAPEFNKRYSSFLARMDGFFFDLIKNQPVLMREVVVVVSGSFWKYYRAPEKVTHAPFEDVAGDFSTHATIAYRQRMDQVFAQKEFMDPTPSAANGWKTRSLESVNRRWFYQQSEDIFRNRSCQTIRKKSSQLKMVEFELYAPEADPSTFYSNFLQMVSGNHAHFFMLSRLLDEGALRSSASSLERGSPTSNYFHWSSMGGFRMLAEAEKQFLILKSILLTSGQRGGVLLDEGEWFSFSVNFRNRVEALSRAFTRIDLQTHNRAIYLTSHLWSRNAHLWEELVRRVGSGAKVVTSLDLVSRDRFASVLVVDPSVILLSESVQKILAWAKSGRVVVLPRGRMFSEAARKELEKALGSKQKISVDFGLNYSVHPIGDGKLLVYDVPERGSLQDEPVALWRDFLDSVLSLAEIQNYCQISDLRLSMIPFETKQGDLALFILNGTERQITSELVFSKEVQISDLGIIFSKGSQDVPEEAPVFTQKFTLDVPPFGVLPLSVVGLSLMDYRERKLAASVSDDTKKSATDAALSELPGFDQSVEELWN